MRHGHRNRIPHRPDDPAMTGLAHLVAAPGAASLPWFDPVFPDRQLILHAARPADWHPGMPVLFVHHGVARNGRDYRDYWLGHAIQGHLNAVAAANKAGAGKGKPAFKLKLKSAMPGTGAAGGAAKAGKMSFAQAKAKGDVAGMASALDL